MNTDVYYAAQQAEDILDNNYGVAQSLDFMIGQSDERRREQMIERMRATIPSTTSPKTEPTVSVATDPSTPTTDKTDQTSSASDIKPAPNPFNFFSSQANSASDTNDPYPADMQQKVIQPINPVNTSGKAVSADIMNLANDAQLSIETIAHEANRINNRDNANGEVVVSLR
jgi:hypothetical protein